ncbi:hypothetical protein [Saccharopolyspora sp. 5N708]|uniref:hypothetical protein n=1 Tax=Saccharopolyspora sp. 5N708 TaxID=3457424 RepID=UPI003FD1AF61
MKFDEVPTNEDYGTWGWKQIKAAICGGSEMSTDRDREGAASVADPQSLWTAGAAFNRTRQLFELCRTTLEQQRNATKQVWRGPAADAFDTGMDYFGKVVDNHVEQLGGGRSGGDSVAQELVDAGNKLQRAQWEINQIDAHYAAWAEQNGADKMDNGLIMVSQKGFAVDGLDRQMREVITRLGGEYQIAHSKLRPAPPPNFSVTNPNSAPAGLNSLGVPGMPGASPEIGAASGGGAIPPTALDSGGPDQALGAVTPPPVTPAELGLGSTAPTDPSTQLAGTSGATLSTPSSIPPWTPSSPPPVGASLPGGTSGFVPMPGGAVPTTRTGGAVPPWRPTTAPPRGASLPGGGAPWRGAADAMPPAGRGIGAEPQGVNASGMRSGTGLAAEGAAARQLGASGTPGGSGMPIYPPGAMGAGAGGGGGTERQRETWLVADESVWASSDDPSASVIGREDPAP